MPHTQNDSNSTNQHALMGAAVLLQHSKSGVEVTDGAGNVVGSSTGNSNLANILQDLTSVTGFLIFMWEGISSAYSAYKAYRDKINANGQRKSKILTNLFVALTAGAGAGLSASYFAAVHGAVVSGSVFMPIITSAMIGGICLTQLAQLSYQLNQANKLKKEAEEELEVAKHAYRKEQKELLRKYLLCLVDDEKIRLDLIDDPDKKLLKTVYIRVLEKQLAHLEKAPDIEFNLDDTLGRIKNKANDLLQSFSPPPTAFNPSYHHHGHSLAFEKLEAAKSKLKLASEREEETEREIAFKSMEFLGSLFSLAGCIIGASALLGGVTFGIAPVAILIGVGVGIGLGFKVLEWRDKKHGHEYSNRFIHWLKGLGKNKKPELAEKPAPLHTNNAKLHQTFARTAEVHVTPSVRAYPPVGMATLTTKFGLRQKVSPMPVAISSKPTITCRL